MNQLLLQWNDGDVEARDSLVPLVYDELRRLAASYLRRERVDHTLQPTALVHEAYLRLSQQEKVQWQDKHHFFGVIAQLMRRILVDSARRRLGAKRGSGGAKVPLTEAFAMSKQRPADLVALDDALKRLSEIDNRQSQVIELRVFGGLEIGEVAEVLKISSATVKRDWIMGKGWLLREIGRANPS
ncbi:MAG: sigma-70 family RNA polymerase sigma factor [Acidobacteria bacterium]|nr:sigma-70 family RNA polymerase sigma factor [Acidobacteriota bacterium]